MNSYLFPLFVLIICTLAQYTVYSEFSGFVLLVRVQVTQTLELEHYCPDILCDCLTSQHLLISTLRTCPDRREPEPPGWSWMGGMKDAWREYAVWEDNHRSLPVESCLVHKS